MNRKLNIAIGIVISLSLIGYLFYKIDYNSVIRVLKSFNTNILIVLFLIYIVGMALRSKRWHLLIRRRERINNILVFKALAIGYMINNLLPAKVGELARVEYIKRKQGIGRSFLLGTIFIERLVDVLMVMVFLAISLFFSQTSRNVVAHNQWIIYLLTGAIFLSFYLMFKPKTISWIIKLFPDKLRARLEQIVISFTDAIQFINNRQLLFGVGFLSVIIWCLTLLSAYSILWGIGVTLPVHAYFFLIAAGVLGVVIPSTSGGIGVYHAISTGALILFNIAPEKALAYAIISHAFDFFPNIILGLCIIGADNTSKVFKTKHSCETN